MAIEPRQTNTLLTFGPYQPTVFPKWDSLRPEGFDASKYELNYRIEHSMPEEGRDITIVALLLCALVVFAIRIFGVWTLAIPVVNEFLTSPKLFPMWAFVGLAVAVAMAAARFPWWAVALGAITGPAVSVFLILTGGAEGADGGFWKIVLLVPTFAMLGYLADQVLTHAVYWMSASSRLSMETLKRRRAWWDARFDRDQLAVLAEKHAGELKLAIEASNRPLVEALRAQLAERSLLERYERGFWILILCAALALLPRNLGLLIFIPPAALVLGSFWNRMENVESAIKASWNAVVLWATYGRFGTNAPGVFQSPSGEYLLRMAVSAGAFFLLAVSLVPSTPVLIEGDPHDNSWGWSLLINVILGTAVPFLIAFVTLVCLGGELLASVERATEEGGADWRLTEDQSPWEILQGRLRASSFEEERRSLWFGIHAISSYPIIVPMKTVHEHVHEIGATGSGKTSRGIAPLMTQFIRTPKGEPDDSAVIILDFKGDRALFENARLEAERKGVPFRYFTNIQGFSTAVFNPVSQLMSGTFTSSQAAQILMAALGLEHGAGYGRSYFSRMAREWLVEILGRFPSIRSFEELSRLTEGNTHFTSISQKRECGELVAAIRLLGGYSELNHFAPGTPVAEGEISMARVLEDREVVYFYLPAGLSLGTIREIGSLALYTAYTAAVARKNSGAEPRRCHVLIDEFQIIANKTFEMVIEQARGLGINLVLSNQNLFDLKTPDAGFLLNVVQSNTRVRRYSSIDDPVVQNLVSKASGETVYVNAFYGEDMTDPASGLRPYLGPRLSRNDIIALSADPSLAILHITRDDMKGPKFGGLMFPVRSDFHVSMEEFKARESAPWPEVTPFLVSVGGPLGIATKEPEPPVPLAPPWMAEVIADVTTEVSVPESPLEPKPPEPQKKPTVRPPVAARPAVTVKKRAVVEQLSLPVAVVVQSTLAERLNQAFANQFEKGK